MTTRFRAEDLTEPKQVADALNKLREELGARPRQTIGPIGLITGADVDDAFPLPLLETGPQMPPTPSEVRIGFIENLTDPHAAWTSAVAVFWKPVGTRRFQVTYISGLSANTKYRVSFVCE